MAENESHSFMWFLMGLGIGTALGVLYAPAPGNETRESIRARAMEGRDFVNTRAKEVREQANEFVDRGRDILNEQKEQFKSAFAAGRQAYDEATNENPKT